jgi:hypothetical protein
VVLAAKSAAGADLIDVQVTMDGNVLATKLDGLAIDVDPGAHTFVFATPNGPVEQRVVVPEGAKAFRVAVGPSAGAGPAPPTPPPAAGAAGAAPVEAPTGVQSGLSFGLRLGYAFPAGSFSDPDPSSPNSDTTLGGSVSGMAPVWVDAGYLVNPYFYIGAYFSYGFAQAAGSLGCGTNGLTCTLSNLRAGVDVQVRPLGVRRLQPWIGVGIGYEGFNFSGDMNGASLSISYTGVELVNPQAGFDYKFLPALSAGVFTGVSVGEYLGTSTSSGGAQQSADLTGRHSLHEWIYVGARATYDLHL